MTKSGLVSVLIPVYNRREFVEAALQSVFDQDYASVEVIVVDDGSSDGSYEVLEHYKARGAIRLLSHPERKNCGQSASINLALRQAKGEFIAILDSDDLFERGKLTKQVQYLKQHPECGLVYGMGKAIDADGNPLYDILSSAHQERNNPGDLLIDCYFHLPVNSLVRKSVYDQVGGFEESFRAAQDHDMLIRMAEVTQFGFLPELMFYYRRHAGSISNLGAETRWKTGFEILRRARERYPYPAAVVRKRAAVLHFRMGEVRLTQRRYAAALFNFAKAALFDPVRSLRVLAGREKT